MATFEPEPEQRAADTLVEKRLFAEVKVCPECHIQNDAFLLYCECGKPLEKVSPVHVPAPLVPSTAQSEPGHLQNVTMLEKMPPKLWLAVGAQTFECTSGDVLGREGTLACQAFASISTVSSKHVSVELRQGQWHLINLALLPGRQGKNITQLDGREIPVGASAPLVGEHVLKMSSQCEVRLRVAAT